MIRQPLAVGLKICEKAVVERNTGNVTLVNCLRRLRFTTFPAITQPIFAFISVTDGQGGCDFEIVVNRLETMDVVAAHKWKATFVEPLQERWFLVPLGPTEFRVPGRYEVVLFADGEWVTRGVIDLVGEKQ